MKPVYFFLGIVAATALVILVWKLFRTNDSVQLTGSNIDDSSDRVAERENPYLEIRSMALNFPASQVDIEKNANNPIVYGVVMDWNVGPGVATFVGYSSGDASMYTSSGGGIIGGYAHESVAKAAKALVQKAAEFMPKAEKSEDTTTPTANKVKFFLLTTEGRFVAEEELEDFDNGTSELLELFVEANKLIGELRALDEQKKAD